MENPDTWGPAERVVAQALQEVEDRKKEFYAGLSTVRVITDALRKAGLLIEPPPGELAPGIRG